MNMIVDKYIDKRVAKTHISKAFMVLVPTAALAMEGSHHGDQ
ncbi:MAG: hypothetical protein ACOH2B_13660 [Burkholderiaceae bacterium]